VIRLLLAFGQDGVLYRPYPHPRSAATSAIARTCRPTCTLTHSASDFANKLAACPSPDCPRRSTTPRNAPPAPLASGQQGKSPKVRGTSELRPSHTVTVQNIIARMTGTAGVAGDKIRNYNANSTTATAVTPKNPISSELGRLGSIFGGAPRIIRPKTQPDSQNP
jgi:hypothetical protein